MRLILAVIACLVAVPALAQDIEIRTRDRDRDRDRVERRHDNEHRDRDRYDRRHHRNIIERMIEGR